jgi:hypothetical protein
MLALTLDVSFFHSPSSEYEVKVFEPVTYGKCRLCSRSLPPSNSRVGCATRGVTSRGVTSLARCVAAFHAFWNEESKMMTILVPVGGTRIDLIIKESSYIHVT